MEVHDWHEVSLHVVHWRSRFGLIDREGFQNSAIIPELSKNAGSAFCWQGARCVSVILKNKFSVTLRDSKTINLWIPNSLDPCHSVHNNDIRLMFWVITCIMMALLILKGVPGPKRIIIAFMIGKIIMLLITQHPYLWPTLLCVFSFFNHLLKLCMIPVGHAIGTCRYSLTSYQIFKSRLSQLAIW